MGYRPPGQGAEKIRGSCSLATIQAFVPRRLFAVLPGVQISEAATGQGALLRGRAADTQVARLRSRRRL